MDYSELLFAVAIRERAHQFMRQAAKERGQDIDDFTANNDANKYIEMAVDEAERVAKVIRHYATAKESQA